MTEQMFQTGLDSYASSVNSDYLAHFNTSNGYVWVLAHSPDQTPWSAVKTRLFVDSLRSFLEDLYYTLPEEALKKALEHSWKAVQKKSKDSSHVQGFSLHFSCLLLRGDNIYLTCGGLCKIFRLSDKRFEEVAFPAFNPTDSSFKNLEIKNFPLIRHHQYISLTQSVSDYITEQRLARILLERSNIDFKAEKIIQEAAQANTLAGSVQVIDFNKVPTATTRLMNKLQVVRPLLWPLVVFTGIVLLIWGGNQWQQQQEEVLETKLEKKQQEEQNEALLDSLNKVDKQPDTIITHIVQKKENVGIIAKKYNSTRDAVSDINSLNDQGNIFAGQALKVNVKMIYRLERDQTLEELYESRFRRWRKYGITPESIVKANKTSKDSLQGVLKKGRNVIIPAFGKEK